MNIRDRLLLTLYVFAGIGVLCFAAGILSGCASSEGVVFTAASEPIVWPGPPDKARIRYVGSISTEEDLKRGKTWSEGFTELIFGKKDIGVVAGPSAVVKGPGEKLYIADGSGGVIHVFGLLDRTYKQFSALDGRQTLMMPVGLSLVDERIYVADSMLGKVCVFGLDGKFLFDFGAKRFKRPTGIAYNSRTSRVYVSDTGNHVINVFDKNGEFIENIGSRGTEEGKFNFPTYLWVDGAGRLYVSDTLNYRIQVFSVEGKFVMMFGEQGDGPGYFAHPAGVAVDSLGNIYVTDRQFENFQIFDQAGRLLLPIGGEGSGPGQFWLPAGVYVDKAGRIYIADSFNKRVQVFELLEVENE